MFVTIYFSKLIPIIYFISTNIHNKINVFNYVHLPHSNSSFFFYLCRNQIVGLLHVLLSRLSKLQLLFFTSLNMKSLNICKEHRSEIMYSLK